MVYCSILSQPTWKPSRDIHFIENKFRSPSSLIYDSHLVLIARTSVFQRSLLMLNLSMSQYPFSTIIISFRIFSSSISSANRHRSTAEPSNEPEYHICQIDKGRTLYLRRATAATGMVADVETGEDAQHGHPENTVDQERQQAISYPSNKTVERQEVSKKKSHTYHKRKSHGHSTHLLTYGNT